MYYLLNLIKFSVRKTITEKNTGKWGKNTGKVREFFQSGKVGTLCPTVSDSFLAVDLTIVCNEWLTITTISIPSVLSVNTVITTLGGQRERLNHATILIS